MAESFPYCLGKHDPCRLDYRRLLCLAGDIAVLADTLTLKDGTILHGRVLQNGNNYWIKFDDGSSKTIAAEDVAKFDSEQAGPGGSSTGPISTARARANNAESALAAVAIWGEFIDKNPNSPIFPPPMTN